MSRMKREKSAEELLEKEAALAQIAKEKNERARLRKLIGLPEGRGKPPKLPSNNEEAERYNAAANDLKAYLSKYENVLNPSQIGQIQMIIDTRVKGYEIYQKMIEHKIVYSDLYQAR